MTSIGFIGLGNMGAPMASRLAAAGHDVTGFDVSPPARERLVGVTVADSASNAVAGASAVILMLPSSAVVRDALLDGGLLNAVGNSATIIDMGSSEPLETRALAAEASRAGVCLIDAPVSGGVRGARDGTLTIMAGGPAARVEICRPLFETLGTTLLHVGPVGAGHALKALNNLLSATSLLASSEAVRIGRHFGLEANVMLAAINASTGRSYSTERKLPDFVLSETYASGFALALMIKDIATACSLGTQLGAEPTLGRQVLELWEEAAGALPPDADHTEIARWVDGRQRKDDERATKEEIARG
jgi:3-hydroxyisobutyrate dehydrogenase